MATPQEYEQKREQFEEMLEEIPEKDLLYEMLVELKTIRHGLQTGEFGEYETDDEPEPSEYRCKTCNETVGKDDRENHLVSKHNYPREMPVVDEFTEL